MADLSNLLTAWLKRRRRLRKPRKPSPTRKAPTKRSYQLAKFQQLQQSRGPRKPRWVTVGLYSTGLIVLTSVGLLIKFAFSAPPPSTQAVKDRRPEQQAICEKLVKNKLHDPASYKLLNGFSETNDDRAQRTFEWTFSSRDTKGGMGKGAAICKASNHLQMATIEVKQVE